MTISVIVDLRDQFGPVRNQGARPTCLAFATSDTHAAFRDGWEALSVEYLFHRAQQRTNRTPHQGATVPGVLDALCRDGQPPEASWPYLKAIPADVSQWQPPASASPLYRRAGKPGGDKVAEIIAQLDVGRPVITLMRLSRSFYRPAPGGVVDEAANDPPDYNRRHAIIAVGHGTLHGKRVVLVRNSWGNRWGDNGHAWVTETFLMPRVFRLAHLMEDLSVSPGSNAA
jgi:hypothetical protein